MVFEIFHARCPIYLDFADDEGEMFLYGYKFAGNIKNKYIKYIK